MKNPLNRRFLREIKGEFGKYLVLFIFIAGTISIVSGMLVASKSMKLAYDEGFEKYNIEDGNFETLQKADEDTIEKIEQEQVTLYENTYIELEADDYTGTIRIFKNREEVNTVCLMEGKLPQKKHEMALDRMHADNNDISVGDTIVLEGKERTVCGLVALPDYSCLYQSPSDMMFDAMQFGVAIVTEEGFDSFGNKNTHYSYSWKYDEAPEDDVQAQEMSEDFVETLGEHVVLANYIPQYSNQAIQFAGDDIGRDGMIIIAFLYVIVVIIAFIFAITTANTIAKESTVIGTLRASGYTKREMLVHYTAMPMLVTLISAIIGNVLGYTVLKDVAASLYYNSYSLTTYVTRWNMDAFWQTTIVPLVLMLIINVGILVNKLSLSPLRFIRRDLNKRQRKKAFRLNTKIGIMKRFRLRIIFQNKSNYITIIIGIFLANIILLFGLAMPALLEKYQQDITSNMLCKYQYVLKVPSETETKGAEKCCMASLKTIEGKLRSEDVSMYGIEADSDYVDLELDSKSVYISSAYAEKFDIKTGDEIELKEPYGTKKYHFQVKGTYDYPAGIAVFMSKELFQETYDYEDDYFNAYFSEREIEDIDEMQIATKITKDDLTKTSRQLEHSMGGMMDIFLVFGIILFMLIIYLLSKIIIEKNMQSISMTKILGYTDKEISGLYILVTSIVVIASFILTMPFVNQIMGQMCEMVFAEYSGWLPYYVPFSAFLEIIALGIAAYAVIAFILFRRVKKVPLDIALKNVE